MTIAFDFRREPSSIFGTVHRPVAQISFKSLQENRWLDIWLIVDTGADYTILPHYLAEVLGVDLKQDGAVHQTSGIGGSQEICLVPKVRVRLGSWGRRIPVGFLARDSAPPLMGRQRFLETFDVRFSKDHRVFFRN